jgi:hypothetical protein
MEEELFTADLGLLEKVGLVIWEAKLTVVVNELGLAMAMLL